MKRTVIAALVLVLLLSFSAYAEQKGPFADTIYFDVRMQEEIALKDTAMGNTDVFAYGVSAPMLRGLDKATLDKFEFYSVPSATYTLLLNPIPNKAPYTHTVNGKEVFNPFAIREIRFALNFLINRKYIVDEILGGSGGPMYTITTPGQPGTIPYELNAAKMGFTAEGDEARALKEIDEAMTSASQLPELKGKLKKQNNFWMFNGEPVTIKFVIRVDDPNVRVKEGEYLSQQFEKAGFKVEKLMYDRSKASNVVYGGNPADYEWTIYTEAWSAGATRAYWAHIVAQFYGPWYGYMPGGGNPENWNYTNDQIDKLSIDAYSGNILTEEEYWDKILEAQTLGLQDAVRVMVAYEKETFVANKAAFEQRMAYGLGDGLNSWSLITAKPKSGTLRVTQYSAKGSLFMNAWDPVGVDGFTDTYTRWISDLLYDYSQFESPVDGLFVPNRAYTLEYDTKVSRNAGGELVGEFEVPADALVYDPKANKWVEIGPGKKVMSKGTYKMVFSNFHHGIPMSFEDYIYADAFQEEWRTEDYPGDPWYDAEYDSQVTPLSDTTIAQTYNDDGTITVYGNYNFPADKEYAAAELAPGWSVSPNAGVGVVWEIAEALARMVAQGSASGERWSFSFSKKGTTEVDVLNPKCVADIKAELNKMIDEKYVPDSLKGYTTVDRAIERYRAAIKFIDNYGHAYISNGPFYLAKFDPKANYAEVKAFRDPSYPYTSQHWLDTFARTILTVENVELPMLNVRGKDIPVKIRVSQAAYPEITPEPATVGSATISLLTDQGEVKFEAVRTAPGVFEATISGASTKDLKPGTYTVLVLIGGDKKVAGTNLTKTIVLR